MRRHCSEETLLAYADGELSRRKARRVKKHLSACWSCRARLQTLERQVQLLARRFALWNVPAGDQIAKARNRLFQRVQRYEAAVTASLPKFQLIDPGRPGVKIAVSVALLLVILAGGIWLANPSTPSGVEKLIRQARQSETDISTQGVHQRLAVELIQERPVLLARSWEVDIWSDQNDRRFALELKEPGGPLKYGLWRPHARRELVYTRETGTIRKRKASGGNFLFQIAVSETELDGFQRGLMQWLEGRRWHPISLASDFGLFADQDEDVLLGVEETRSPSGRSYSEISAFRQGYDRTVELRMQVDAVTFRPQRLWIRLITPSAQLELRLIVEHFERMEAESLSTAVFEPHLPSVTPPVLDRPERVLRRIPSNSEIEREGASILPGDDPIMAVEMEIRYALHQARACLGEAVDIFHKPTGGLLVQGVVSTRARKKELLGSLAALDAPGWVEIDIKSAEDLVGRGDGFSPVGTSASTLSISGREVDLYFEQELKEYFKGTGAEAPGPVATEFVNRTVTFSDELLTQAWALRQLAERFKPDEFQMLRPQSRWLLERMARDHLEVLGERARGGHLVLEPVLHAIGGGVLKDSGDSTPAAELSWDQALIRLFDVTEQVRANVTSLFAGAGLPVQVAEDAKAVEIKSPQRTLEDLLTAMSSLEDRLQQAEAQTGDQFSANVPAPPR